MDPFTRLPAELRLQIFLHLLSKATISSLIQASPTMLEQYLGYKSIIIRHLLERDLDDQMIQDAMAIILYPSLRKARKSKLCFDAHLLHWECHKLRNPLLIHDAVLLDQLDKLHSLLMVFVEDYITKATADFQPREYICLPQPTHSQSHLVFKGQKVAKRFDSCNLSEGERRRLLRAFLKVELGSLNMRTTSFESDPFAKRRILSYVAFGGNRRDEEAIRCVWVYTSSLYGAIFAQCADAWLPVADARPETGLLFPDNVLVDPIEYGMDVGIKGEEKRSAIESMAQYGFTLIFTMIRFAIAKPQYTSTLKSFVEKLCSFRTDITSEDLFGRGMPWGGLHGLSHSTGYRYSGGDLLFDEQPWWKYLGTKLYLDNGGPMQYKIFQQRAWPIFDDDRHYPVNTAALPVLPTPYFFKKMAREMMPRERINDFMSFFEIGSVSYAQLERRARELRRTQKWQDKMKQRQGSDWSTESSLPWISLGNHEVSLPVIESQEQLLTWNSRGVVRYDESKEAYVVVKE
ncbi:uncharacterized protein FTJAE_3352 [Fusarium tjaetaba]|uniref:Uncharacterized protein n=1 Tax=Fusarium tjaetaba TaxID=1567544 RepID=A0A8H5S3P4_9HYPO|nr:uncharacterized protein FTJAE_3352 [Fusarium tjaetaba]KAF5643552.1 hypothetical protein FTJAE_3352 [Fusarium tjaetaba]